MEKLSKRTKVILLVAPIVFAVALAVTLAAIMAQAGKKVTDPVGETPVQVTVPVGETFSAGLEYETTGEGKCTLVGIGNCTDKVVRVAEKNELGEVVTAVSSSAFFGNGRITEVLLPDSVTSIGNYSFYSSSLEKITIPRGVTAIGECVFANCKSLSAINVADGNEKFCSMDGVLFSKDKSVIYCYPAGKSGANYTIRGGITEIKAAAFLNCDKLTAITFNGSETAWRAVKIGSNNPIFDRVQVKFNTSTTK